MSKKLIRIDLEESKRKVAGLSGCRRCLFISEYQTQLEIEKRFADKKGGDRILSRQGCQFQNSPSCGFRGCISLDLVGQDPQGGLEGRSLLNRHPQPVPMSNYRWRSLIAWVRDP